MRDGDRSFDFIIVGGGAASVCAALAVKEAGKSALIVEKEDYFGGSTALSGGVLWIPNNSLQQEAGVADSPELARAYLDACAGAVTRGSSVERRKAFLSEGPRAIDFLRRHGMKLVHGEGYACYHETEYPGGIVRGRSIVPAIFDLNELGEYAGMVRYNAEFPPMMTHETFPLTRYGRDWKSKKTMVKVGLRVLQNRLFGRKLVGIGASLQGRLLQLALRNKIPVWLSSPVTQLLTEDGKVTGVIARRNGEDIRLRADLGVLINSGGFARNAEMRNAYHQQPTSTDWTVSNLGDTGEVLQMAMGVGADVERMDLCWWVPGTFPPEGGVYLHVFEIARPHAIVVDQQGQRFTNEATSYVKIGIDIYNRNKTVGAIPSWIIIDSRNRERYVWGLAPPGRTPEAWLTSGYMKKASSIADLARQCDLDAGKLQATIDRFNGFAREGTDHDFGRGASAYGRFLGDPTCRPNPNLGTIEKPPFYAVQLYPKDVGTCGGIVTDEFARALNKDGQIIPGLYACGNATASVCGPSYPGAGASIGASLTFGFIAAKHAVRANA